MDSRLVGVFIEDDWVATSYFTILRELKRAEYVPLLITTNREWDAGLRRSIPARDEPFYYVPADLSVGEVDISRFAGFVFGGGYWADKLRWWFLKTNASGTLERPEVRNLVERIVQSSAHVIGVICHAMWILVSLKETVGARRVTCAYNIIDDVRNAGFTYEDTDVCVDGNLVTGRMSHHSEAFIKKYIDLMERQRG